MTGTNPVRPIDVGQYILDYFFNQNKKITTLKLQKLVYYSQAWSLVWDDAPLFEEDFEAWVNGPVVVSLFHALKGYYSCPRIIESAETVRLSADQKDTINHVLEYYGNFTSSELVNLTHQEDPWKQARGELSATTPCNNCISKESMLDFYLTLQAE